MSDSERQRRRDDGEENLGVAWKQNIKRRNPNEVKIKVASGSLPR